MARAARQEALEPPPVLDYRSATTIPTLQAQLCASLAMLYALGGGRLERSDELAVMVYSATAQPIQVVSLAQNALDELARVTGQHHQLPLAEPANATGPDAGPIQPGDDAELAVMHSDSGEQQDLKTRA